MELVAKSLVVKPRALRRIDKLDAFKRMIGEELEKMGDGDKHKLAFEIVVFVCSLAEVYWIGRRKGETKKEAVMDCLLEANVESKATLERMVELALESGKVIKKTKTLKLTRYLKKLCGQLTTLV